MAVIIAAPMATAAILEKIPPFIKEDITNIAGMVKKIKEIIDFINRWRCCLRCNSRKVKSFKLCSALPRAFTAAAEKSSEAVPSESATPFSTAIPPEFWELAKKARLPSLAARYLFWEISTERLAIWFKVRPSPDCIPRPARPPRVSPKLAEPFPILAPA